MKGWKRFLVAAIIVFLVTVYNGGETKTEVSAATTQKTVTKKAASDFTLKLPTNWKGNYIIKKGKDKSLGSYVAFYAKKCYKQTKEGWLFTIVRCKDDSYTDMPSYELVGKWNGINYVALYPTDVQCLGVTTVARKQYTKLNQSSAKVAASIQPVKKVKKKKGLYCVSDFSLKLPNSWRGNYIVKKSKKKKHNSYLSFYSQKCYKEAKAGFLFSIVRYKDDSYTEMPSYELVGKWNGYNYVAIYPTDVSSIGTSKAAQKQYSKLNQSARKVACSISPLK